MFIKNIIYYLIRFKVFCRGEMVCVGWEVNYFQITDVETIPMEALNAKATTAHLLLDEACQLNIEETGIG